MSRIIKKFNGLCDRLRRMWIYLHVVAISDPAKKADWLRKHNVFHYMGEKVIYKTTKLPAEPFLVAIHDNVIVAADVRLVTHSLTSTVFNNKTNSRRFYAQYGKIEIHSNVFVGAGATIMYGVTIGENCIVAAGAIVTKDVPSGCVVGGIPAKVIGTFDESMRKADEASAVFVGKARSRQVADLVKIVPVEFDIDKACNEKREIEQF